MGAASFIISTIVIAGTLAAGLCYLVFGKLISGLMGFGGVARQWKSEDKQKVSLMRSLGFVAVGLANLIIALIIGVIIGVIIAIIPK